MMQAANLMLLGLIQRIIILVVRPYVSREFFGWGKVYGAFVGNFERNWLWRSAPTREIRGKRHGYLMCLDLAQWPDRATYFLGRWYALDIQLFLSDVVALGDTVVDVGANRGMFTYAASRLVGETGRVICFEPNPNCAAYLERHITLNGIENVFIHQYGLAEENGELTLVVPHINSGEGTFGRSVYEPSLTHAVQAKTTTGDEALRSERPTLIKLDVEGFECRALAGLRHTIECHHPIVITEVYPRHLEACSSSKAELLSFMESLSYTGFKLGLVKKRGSYTWMLFDPSEECNHTDWVWFHPIDMYRLARVLEAHKSKPF